MTDDSSVHFTVGKYTVSCAPNGLLRSYATLRQNAALAEEFGFDEREGQYCTLSVEQHCDSPLLVLLQRFYPMGVGYPGLLLIPETDTLFFGAGEAISCYDLRSPARLWREDDEMGFLFYGWRRHGDVVLMSSELKVGAWNLYGRPVWSYEVEPAWYYAVDDETVRLTVNNRTVSFHLQTGPKQR